VMTTRCTCGRCRAHDAGRVGQLLMPAEFAALGLVNEPAPAEVDDEVAAAQAGVTVTEALWDLAVQQWEAAAQARRHTERTGANTAALATARDSEQESWEDRRIVGERLAAARIAYHEAAKASERRRYLEEAEQRDQAQESTAAADRADQDARVDRLLKKVAGHAI
jgi:hypothetical protein